MRSCASHRAISSQRSVKQPNSRKPDFFSRMDRTCPNTYRRGALQVDRILKGTNLNDLPFEKPTKFELVINMKTAKALGLIIPKAIILRATRVLR